MKAVLDADQAVRSIHTRHGAVFSKSKPPEVWADGSVAPAHAFTVDPTAPALALRHMTKTLAELNAAGRSSKGIA